jgi:hypothetical protein
MTGGVPGFSVEGTSVADTTGSAGVSGVASSSAKADAEPAMENTMAIARIDECCIEPTFVLSQDDPRFLEPE